MKDLALQSANGTNSTAQRNNMDLEFQQLISEIDRVVDTTQFNGLNLLDGTQIQNTNFQVDEGSTSTVDTIQVSIGDVQSSGLSGGVGTTLFAGVTASDTFSGNDTITITADPNDSGDISLAYNVTDGTTASALVDMINAESDQHLLSAAIQNGNLVIYQNNTTAASTDSTIALTTGETLGGQAITAAFSIAAGGGTQSLNSTSISTEANANIAIDVLDGAITKITTERATIGASQNRFDKAINNLNNKIVSVSAAMGRIMDADFAKETAEFSKSQILQQAGVSMMAQAKALPNQLLSLLQ
jgi:flagellin